jgi:tripartite-type tricarboxylate transporter receptor subunit TctC
MNRRHLLSAGITLALPNIARAQAFPTKNINLVVPFAAGGNTDVVARIIANYMSPRLGHSIIVENISGAGGTTGTARVAKSAPDGYTLLLGQMGTHAAAVGSYDTLSYDPLTSFDPIGQVSDTPILIIGRKEFPANSLAELIALLKSDPKKFNFAHAGIGSISYSAAVLFNSLIGVTPTLIPFRGSGPAFNDLLSGQVDLMTDQIIQSSQHILTGGIKAFAIATPKRAVILPNVPTTKEAGLPDYLASGWNALYAPKGLPEPIREKLTKALNDSLNDPACSKRLTELGAFPVEGAQQGGEALAKFNKAEIDKWAPVLRAIGK